jgi:hypothetical protein
MAYKTVIKYKIEGLRMYKLPIITIYPHEIINIKIAFPDIEDININTDQNVIIKQTVTEPYPNMNLLVNNEIISSKPCFYNNGTIIITSNNKCDYNETFEMLTDT